jgi:hypothetical protein
MVATLGAAEQVALLLCLLGEAVPEVVSWLLGPVETSMEVCLDIPGLANDVCLDTPGVANDTGFRIIRRSPPSSRVVRGLRRTFRGLAVSGELSPRGLWAILLPTRPANVDFFLIRCPARASS